jgi:hypothetical protein
MDRTLLVAVAVVASVTLATSLRAQERPGGNPHGRLSGGTDCSACHTATAWRPLKSPLSFDHNKTSFPLTGRHAGVACERCHEGLRFDQPGPGAGACASCHADVHQGQIAGDCARCHSTSTFREVPVVALHARAGFPLTGAHLQAPCESCHKNDRGGAFAPLPQDCVSCHREQYTAASMPDHAAAGFPSDCGQCHNSLTWTGGAVFDHAQSANGYALVGAHALLRCADCHVPPGLSLNFTPANQNDCIACHTEQYQRAHGSGGFPTTCLDCHSQDSWSGANFDHSKWFPLRGEHDVSCNRCHTVQGDYTVFECTTCHGQSQTDSRHREVNGYTYDSAACYRCHTNGRGGG